MHSNSYERIMLIKKKLMWKGTVSTGSAHTASECTCLRLSVLVHASWSVAINIFHGHIDDNFAHNGVEYATDEQITECNNQNNCPSRNGKRSWRSGYGATSTENLSSRFRLLGANAEQYEQYCEIKWLIFPQLHFSLLAFALNTFRSHSHSLVWRIFEKFFLSLVFRGMKTLSCCCWCWWELCLKLHTKLFEARKADV